MLAQRLFGQLGCSTCHVPTLVTTPARKVMNGGTFVVHAGLGNKVIHAFGDYLLQDNIGTGDGIVQTPGRQETANKMRTAPAVGPAHEIQIHARPKVAFD